jgi:hypothetical protein
VQRDVHLGDEEVRGEAHSDPLIVTRFVDAKRRVDAAELHGNEVDAARLRAVDREAVDLAVVRTAYPTRIALMPVAAARVAQADNKPERGLEPLAPSLQARCSAS